MKRLSLLDPYCGVGTTLLSAQILPNQVESATGFERNPFAAFVASSKLSWPEIDPSEFKRIAKKILTAPPDLAGCLPELSSIRSWLLHFSLCFRTAVKNSRSYSLL